MAWPMYESACRAGACPGDAYRRASNPTFTLPIRVQPCMRVDPVVAATLARRPAAGARAAGICARGAATLHPQAPRAYGCGARMRDSHAAHLASAQVPRLDL